MENYSFTVQIGNAGVRLDLFLVGQLPKSSSRTSLQKLILQNLVLVNGVSRKPHYKIEAGDFIEVKIPKPRKLKLIAEDIPLDIIFEDDRLIIVNKPAGMVVHPAPGHYSGTLVNALLHYTGKLSPHPDGRPGIVHRLDKDTSGLLIVAKDESAHSFLCRQFYKRTTDKRYLAVVEGSVQLDNGVISAPIGRHPRDRKRMSVKFTEAKTAVTRYKVIERFSRNTLLEIRPETGRTHQIRVHMAYISHPVVMDKAYGARVKIAPISRPALHASEISFSHPTTKKNVSFKAPLPDDMRNLIEELKNRSW